MGHPCLESKRLQLGFRSFLQASPHRKATSNKTDQKHRPLSNPRSEWKVGGIGPRNGKTQDPVRSVAQILPRRLKSTRRHQRIVGKCSLGRLFDPSSSCMFPAQKGRPWRLEHIPYSRPTLGQLHPPASSAPCSG